MNTLQRIQPPVFPVEKVILPVIGETRLNNGVPVFLIGSGTEEIMRLDFIFRAGQVKEDMPLLASTTNMMLTEGSINYSSEELGRLLDFYGIFHNLNSDKDIAGITLYFLNKHVDKVLELTREILFRPLFPEPELKSLMNKRLRWYLVNREKVSNLATDKFFESAFGKDHPYGRQVHEEDFGQLNSKAIRNFHSEHYSVANMAVIISGRIHQDTIGLLNKYIGEIKPGETSLRTGKIPRGEDSKIVHVDKQGAVQTAVRIGSATINKRHPDYPGLKILNTILGGYFGSRLMRNIREQKGYTYGISSSVSSLDLCGYKLISTDVNQKYSRETITEILNEIRSLQNVPVSTEELNVVRNYMSGEMVRMFDGPFAIAESFRSVWEFGLDISYYTKISEIIHKIDPDEIIRLARTYYNIDELYQVTAGSK
jgi:zinc protease